MTRGHHTAGRGAGEQGSHAPPGSCGHCREDRSLRPTLVGVSRMNTLEGYRLWGCAGAQLRLISHVAPLKRALVIPPRQKRTGCPTPPECVPGERPAEVNGMRPAGSDTMHRIRLSSHQQSGICCDLN